MSRNNKTKRKDYHYKIGRFQRQITKEFIIDGREEFLFPNSLPQKYFTDMKNNYEAIGIRIIKKEYVMQGTIFEMELME